MKNEKQLLDNFQVEELEKRFEMGWLSGNPEAKEIDTTGMENAQPVTPVDAPAQSTPGR